MMEEDRCCICVNCWNLFSEPTNGGACPACGSSNWTEPSDDIYADILSKRFPGVE